VTKVDASSHDLLSLDLLLVTPAIEQVWKDVCAGTWGNCGSSHVKDLRA
jgi:hypothetical protein